MRDSLVSQSWRMIYEKSDSMTYALWSLLLLAEPGYQALDARSHLLTLVLALTGVCRAETAHRLSGKEKPPLSACLITGPETQGLQQIILSL